MSTLPDPVRSSPLVLRAIDVHDDDVLRAAYDLSSRAELHGREGAPHWSWPEYAGTIRRPQAGQVIRVAAGWVDGRMVGTVGWFYNEHHNLDKATVMVAVDPAARRRGHGRALCELACDALADVGRTTLLASTRVPFDRRDDHPYRHFAEACGFASSNVEITRHLTLPVDDDAVAAWTAGDRDRTAGYRVETHVNGIPAPLAASYCLLHGQLVVDAPTGEVDYEEERLTPDELAADHAATVAQGRTVLDTLAVTPDGVVAAFSTIMVPPAPRTDASQWGTFVHREHRGHRLGMATKAAALRDLQTRFPSMQRVVTQNAETNRWMISVNEEMGYEAVEVTVELVRRS